MHLLELQFLQGFFCDFIAVRYVCIQRRAFGGLDGEFWRRLEGFGEQSAVAESAVEMPKILPDAENLLTQEEEFGQFRS